MNNLTNMTNDELRRAIEVQLKLAEQCATAGDYAAARKHGAKADKFTAELERR